MTTTMIKSTSHRIGRTVANAHRYFNRFEARVAGRFSFAGGLSVRIVFWMIRIAMSLVAAFVAIMVLPFILPLLFVWHFGVDPEDEDADRARRRHQLLEEQSRERDELFEKEVENDARWADWIMNDGDPYGPYPES